MFSGKVRKKSLYPRVLTALIVLTLLGSFGLHSMQITHTHPGHTHFGEETSKSTSEVVFSLHEFIHGNEQKMFLFVVLAVLLLGCFLLPRFLYGVALELRNAITCSMCNQAVLRSYSVFDKLHSFFILLFRTGVLNPNLH